MVVPTQQLDFTDTIAPGTSAIGLLVSLSRECCCGSAQASIGSSPGFCGAVLICTNCNCHTGWLPGGSFAFIAGVIDPFGRPSEPIVIRSPNSGRQDPKPAAPAGNLPINGSHSSAL
jgi:hypothetical protein